MIVGHNPDLSDLVSVLIAGEVGRVPLELKKGAVAALSSIPGKEPLLQLDWVAPPRLLRRISPGL
jgi:phosphohistidine phosphatase